MDHPDKPGTFSVALAGVVAEKPEEVISIVLKDGDGDPAGVLEKWNGDCWFYAPVEDLVELN